MRSMKKSTISLILAAAAVILIVLSFAIPDSPIWLSIAGLVLAVLAIIFADKGWRRKQ